MDSGFTSLPPPANDAGGAEDVRVELRKDHDAALRDLEALGHEKDERRCRDRLRELRQAWMTHALAEETVVYRALEGVQPSEQADERFIEHELVGGLFEKLAQARPGTHEWSARLKVIGDLIRRHIDIEHDEVFSRLAKHVDAEGLRNMGESFRAVHAKLRMLERLKAA